MSFQIPPTLPDYSKLTFMLNSSGVQKWNPDVYNILKNLIFAVQQSQTVVSDSITAISGGSTGVLVDPAGAILGDGAATPLKSNVDNTTVQIIANQLTALGTLKSVTTTLNHAQILAWSVATQFTAVPAAGANTIVIPVLAVIHCVNAAFEFSANNVCKFVYSAAAGSGTVGSVNVMFGGQTAQMSSVAAAAFDRHSFLGGNTFFVDKNTPAAGGGSPINKDVLCTTPAGLIGGGGATTGVDTIKVYYIVATDLN